MIHILIIVIAIIVTIVIIVILIIASDLLASVWADFSPLTPADFHA